MNWTFGQENGRFASLRRNIARPIGQGADSGKPRVARGESGRALRPCGRDATKCNQRFPPGLRQAIAVADARPDSYA